MTVRQTFGAALILLFWAGMIAWIIALYPNNPVFAFLVATLPVMATTFATTFAILRGDVVTTPLDGGVSGASDDSLLRFQTPQTAP